MLYLGIDVSKAKLDCLLLDPRTNERQSKTVPNLPKGYTALLQWLDKENATRACVIMEPTGGYHEHAALALHDAGMPLSLVDPKRVRKYAEALGIINKTDRADSGVLARYGAEQHPRLWRAPSMAARLLQSLLARARALETNLLREQNRLEKVGLCATPNSVEQSIRESISFHQRELNRLQKEIDQHIADDPELHEKRTLLLTIPGAGARLSAHMTELFATHDFRCAEQLAAYLGLTPVLRESGTSVHTRPHLSKKLGARRLRALFFYPALCAISVNPHVKAIYTRLRNRGKCKMSAVAAAMHKLAHLCFGVVKTRKPYHPNWQVVASKTVYAQRASPQTPFHLCMMSDE